MHQSNLYNNDGNHDPDDMPKQSVPQPVGETPAKEDLGRLLREINEFRFEMREFTAAVRALVKRHSETIHQVSDLPDVIRELHLQVERMMIPIAEQNRDLRLKEVDEKYFRPIMNALAQIIDRQSAEISQAESESLPLALIENCRAIDRRELQDLMSMFDVESFSSLPGSVLDPKLHSVKTVRTTPHQARIGRVIRTFRPGYRRHSDGFLIRRALVEIWGQAATKDE